MKSPFLRAVSDCADDELIEQALESISRTYVNITAMLMAHGWEPPGMSGLVAQAHMLNEQIIALTRHPSGGR